MPNKNYLRGRRFEYDRVQAHKDAGALEVYRTAGSHGNYDVIAFYDCAVIMEQCKTKKRNSPVKTPVITARHEWPEQIKVIQYRITKEIRK